MKSDLLSTTSLTAHVPEEFRDFRNWLFVVWQHLNLPDPTPIQYDIASWLQNGPKRLITEAFRGVGKSFVTAAFVTHLLLLNPQLKILVVSASKQRADAFSIFVKRLILEMPALMHLAPRDDQRTSNIEFDVGPATNDQSASVKSVGITGQITGSRADVIIADDIESLNNSATADQRLKLGERIKEFDAVLKPGGRIIYLGTPQTEFSIYNELENRGYETRIWPARYPDQKRRVAYGDRLAPMLVALLDAGAPVGGTTDPARFSDLDLAEREASYGKSGFALQFMLDTSLSDQDRYPLRLDDLIVMSLNPEMAPARTIWATSPELALDLPAVGLAGDKFYRPMDVQKPWTPYTGCVMTIDPSGRGKDETGYAIIKIANGMLFLVASGGFQGGYEPETLKALAMLAYTHKAKEVVIEDNFGDGMFGELFKPVLSRVYPCTVTGSRSTGQKERRIVDTLEPVLNQHRLVVDEKVVKADYREEGDLKKSLFYQLTRLTKERGALAHDDRLDALSMAVTYWLEALAGDVERAAVDAKQAEMDQQLQDFMDGLDITGSWKGQMMGPERTWMSQG